MHREDASAGRVVAAGCSPLAGHWNQMRHCRKEGSLLREESGFDLFQQPFVL